MIRKYEGCFLLRADLQQEQLDAEVKYIADSISGNGAVIARRDLLGQKNLAYPVKKQNSAVYAVFYFTAEPGAIPKIESSFTLKENMLRHLIIQRRELPLPQAEAAPEASVEPAAPEAPENVQP